MKVEVRETAPLHKALDIRLEPEEVNRFMDELIDAFRRRQSFPGFRPGKAPDQVVRRRFEDDIERAVFTELIPRSIDRAVAEQGLRPVEAGEVSSVRFRPGEPLEFTVTFPIWPDIQLAPYEEIEIEQVVEGASAEEVEEFLNRIRERSAETSVVEREAQDGDLMQAELETVDAEGQRVRGTKKETVTLEVGSPNLLAEFRDAAAGLSAGQAREFSVHYPDDFPQESLRGETRRYRMKATEIREKKLPPLDDSFARSLDPQMDLESLRTRIRLRLESEHRFAAREQVEEKLVDALIEANPFDLPKEAVEKPLERMLERTMKENPSVSREDLEQVYRPRVERLRRRDLLLGKVAEREGIEVTPADVEGEIARIAMEERRTVEEVRKDLGDIERYRQFLFERKVFEALTGKAKIREIQVPARSRAAQEGAPGAAGAPVAAPAGEEPDRPQAESAPEAGDSGR